MTREEIEENARNCAERIGVHLKIHVRRAYITGAESRDAEIAELVELVRRSRHRMNEYSDYIATEWRKMADRVLEKYEQ